MFQREVKPFTLYEPSIIREAFVFNSPHSGRDYRADFINQSRLEPLGLRSSEDFRVDELFASAISLGAPLMCANFPRAWLDVNREPYELDPTMFEGSLPSYVNIQSSRVMCGLGTIARIVCENEEIYDSKIPAREGLARIESHYKPYHARLGALISQVAAQFGHAVLVDCHSMPSTLDGSRSSARKVKADFVIGDRFGTSCARELSELAAQILREFGYQVALNQPYAGGFITEHYGRPEAGLHALQIEINRALYMVEGNMIKNSAFDHLAGDLKTFMSRLIAIPDSVLKPAKPLAAE